MKKNEANKFDLFKKILFSENGIRIQEIIPQCNDSKSTLYRYVQQINEDLALAFPEETLTIQQTKSLLYVSIPETMSFAYVIDFLRFYYITVSPEYAVFSAAADKNFSSSESLAQSINLSPSYTYKNIKSLNALLKPFKIKTAFGDPSKKTNIYGAESDIRFLLFFAYWDILKGLVWPFNRSPKHFKNLPIPISTALSPSQHTRLRYFQNITYWRILYLQEQVSIDEDFLTYLMILNEVNPTVFTLDLKSTLSPDEIMTEQAYFSFLARFFIADIDTKEMKKRTAQLFIESNLPLANSGQHLLTLLKEKYNLVIDEDDYLIFFYDLMIAFLYVKYIGIDHDSISEYEKHLSLLDVEKKYFYTMEQELNTLIRSFGKNEDSLKIDLPDNLVNYMTNVLFCIVDSSKKIQPLTIFCQYSKNFYTVNEIKSNLLTIFGSKVIRYAETIHEADLVISDCYEGPIDNEKFFYFDNAFDRHTWRALFAFVNSKLYNVTF
ncbi:helix-turn-helix domain-containing protein [Enterococcus ureasiticus]|nr:helix-turn-helix domain-containing protein [Enterococcus ureasiticus]